MFEQTLWLTLPVARLGPGGQVNSKNSKLGDLVEAQLDRCFTFE